MTTRRGFIQGIFAGITALVLPKVAEAEAETITVPHRKAPIMDNLGGFIVPQDIADGLRKLGAHPTAIRGRAVTVEIDDLPVTIWPNSDGDWFAMCGLKPEWHDEDE